MTPSFPDCDLCEGFPDPRLTPSSSLADLERQVNDLISEARLTKSVLVLVPSPLRGYELFEIPPGPRRDMVLTAIGKKP